MTTTNPTGYCSRCNQEVLLKREEIDTCLAIVLLIFTAGIGLLIYLAIYYSKPEDRCIHCGTRITPLQTPSPYTYQTQPLPQQPSYSAPLYISEEITGSKPNFCSLCGEKLDSGISYCPNCGSKISEN